MEWNPVLEDDGRPRYLAIADLIAEEIKNGTLAAGMRLPPQRKLAAKLGIDFTTVTRGYSEARARGLLDSQVGRGTFVSNSVKTDMLRDEARDAAEDLAMNMPPEPRDPRLLEQMQTGLNYVSANLVPLLRYQDTLGGEIDKIAASTWLSLRGLVPKLDRIAVTPGAHPTMAAILSLIADRGDCLLTEKITYPGLRSISKFMGVELIGLDKDEHGLLPCALQAAIKKHKPRALYLNPTLHNPTTLTMPTARRLEIAKVINDHGLALIEDDAYGFIPAKAPAPLAVSAPDLTWHIGGLAKCIGAGLRLAYTVTPSPKHTLALGQALRALTVMPSPISIALATRWVNDGTADNIRRFVRSETSLRQKMAAKAFEGLEFQAAENAFNVWLRLPDGSGRANIIANMAGRHVGITPSDAFTVGEEPDEHVRLCLGGAISREQLQASLHDLAHLLIPGDFMA